MAWRTVAARRRSYGSGRYDEGRRSTILAVELSLCVAWLLGSWLLSTIFASVWWSVASLGTYAWLVILLVRAEPTGAALLLPTLIEKASTFVALALIPFDSQIPELGLIGAPSGCAPAFAVYTAISLVSYVLLFRLLNRNTQGKSGYPLTPLFDRLATPIALGLVAFSGIMILDLLASGARSGFPLLTGMDRFYFRRVFADKGTLYILNLKFVTSFMLGMVVFCLPAQATVRQLAKLAYTALMVMYFLFGDKFFTMLASLSAFFAPYLYLNARAVLQQIGRYAVAAAAALMVVFAVTWFIYSDLGRQNPTATAQRLSGRVVGQGELWYLQYGLGAPVWNWDGEMVDRNIQALTVKDIDIFALRASIGPAFYSNGYAPDKIRTSLHRNAGSVTYTAALEPLGLHTFGWGGLAIMMVIVGFMSALGSAYVALAIRTRSILMGTFAAYVSVQLRTTLAQGTPYVLFSVFSMVWLSVILLIELSLLLVGLSQRRVGQRRPALRAF
ncbi:DUF6418 domain-containing protein [Sphingomonas nostoxanthinifaciens]|uniref:DUF6418 domain-containing protein n=1 Tax=Sphingomonas nostoxanthinifaciens TaxID=2872652 RepID=UPI001CC2135E|nr:DUF6418 domain-containing protein [Sphingomonas nostoxanthinifaciens]UAK25056.1 DUF6418 domain-containing protein [Sphingomonas nostoxanthinifaciens]